MLDNQIQIGEKFIDITPIKMKYMKNSFYSYYMIIEQCKIQIFSYQDGMDIFQKFLIGVFDGNLELIDCIIENLNEKIFDELMSKVKMINEFEEETLLDKDENKEAIDNDGSEKKKVDGLTLRRGYAMLGVYSGLNENILDECTYLYYKDCIKELSIRFNWEIAKHILSQPVLSEEGVKSNRDLINEKYPFMVSDKGIQSKKQVSEGNTLEGLKKLGLDIKVVKANDFVSIEEMFEKSNKDTYNN